MGMRAGGMGYARMVCRMVPGDDGVVDDMMG